MLTAAGVFGWAFVLAVLMLATGIWLGAREFGRPDDGADFSDLITTHADNWADRNERAAWAAVRHDWEADQYRAEMDADCTVELPAGQR